MMNTVLLSGLWQGALISAIAALATIWIPQRHAATRYAVWFTALLALAILPIASLWHPATTALPESVAQTAVATSVVTAKAATASGAWLMLLWLAGVTFCLFRLALSYARINRIVRNAKPVLEFAADVMTSDDVAVPIAARFFSPVVIIPADLLTTLERSDLESVVRHERAHIRRMDIAGNLIQRLIEACLFFNPWVYVIGRQLVKEREAACDDWAVHAAGEPDRYASCLAQLAQSAKNSRTPLLTPSAIGSRRMLVGRIARLLNGKVSQLKVNYVVLGTSVTAFALLAVLFQTSTSLASSDRSLENTVAAAGACVVPQMPKDPSALTSAQRAELKRELLATGASAKPLNPAMPDIPKADFRPNVWANALVTIGPDGTPLKAKIVKSSGSAGIDQATINAAMASTYSPAMGNCKGIVGQYLFQVRTAEKP